MQDLNSEQRNAATAVGSVAVTAGAGTGKTHMLAWRYLFHVREGGMSPLEVVAVTFTEKAADELRSRIRETLRNENIGGEKIAEVDAAQISTIHALAARICRDFYDLAGIPPDFNILDSIESPMWLAEKYGEAVMAIDPELIEELGYDLLHRTMPILLADPITNEAALSVELETWRKALGDAYAAAADELRDCAELAEAIAAADAEHAIGEDALSLSRDCALALAAAFECGEGIFEAAQSIKASRPDHGKKDNWRDGGKDRIQPQLRALKAKVVELLPRLCLTFGLDDAELHARTALLHTAFVQANRYLQSVKRSENVLDFNDLEYYALQILNHPNGEAVRHYRERWKAFLVDEYQDTSPAQEHLIELLTQGAIRTIVGDEKQAIYGFRGADIDVFARSRRRILAEPAGKEVALGVTYRTHTPLVEKTNAIFEPVLGSLHQALESGRTDELTTAPPYITAGRVEKPKGAAHSRPNIVEAHHIAEKIKATLDSGTHVFDKRLNASRRVEYSDIAVLSRKWSPLGKLLEVLSAEGIPAVNTGGGNLLNTHEARDAAALLNFLAEPTDGIPLVAVLRSPFFGISDEQLFDAAENVRGGATWWEVVRRRPEFELAVSVLEDLKAARNRHSAADILRMADRRTGYRAVLANLPHGQRREADWQGMIDLLAQMERRGQGGLFDVVRHLGQLAAAETEVPRPQIDAGNAVTLMTIHKAKGLEWPIVFVCAMSEQGGGKWSDVKIDKDLGAVLRPDVDEPSKNGPAIYKLFDIRRQEREQEEAKRLLYVAVTRGRDRVHLTSAEGGKGKDRELLLPGFEAAGLAEDIIEYQEDKAFVRAPRPPEPFAPARVVQTVNLSRTRCAISATAITSYMTCPLQFRFRHMDGHPGAGEGFARASTVGTLTHLALEHDIADAAGLRFRQPEADEECIAEALRHAECFRTSEAYAAFRGGNLKQEVPFAEEIGGVLVSGKVDLVGEDFVLDYKTDEATDADHHRFQIWVYARAMKKPRGILAFLKNNQVREFGPADLEIAGEDAMKLIEGIRNGEYDAKPSPAKCVRCNFYAICDSRADD